MNKKVLVLIITVVLVVVGIGTYSLLSKKKSSNVDISDGKVLVVYYSATNNTKGVAEKIAKNLNGDLFEIEPEDKYTNKDLDWTDRNSRVSKEHDDESLRDVKLISSEVENWDSYDTVLIGYPIW